MSRTICSLIFVCTSLLSSNLVAQDVTGSVNEGGNIVLAGQIELLGIDLQSEGGYLVPVSGNTAAPFDLFVRNTANQIIYGTLGRPVSVDGQLVLSARYTNGQDFDGDLTGEWGGPEFDGPILFQAVEEVIDDGPDDSDPMTGVETDPIDPTDVDGGGTDPTDSGDPDIDEMMDNMGGDDDTSGGDSGGGGGGIGANPIDEMLPEPGSASMLLVAGAALTLLRRRHR